MIAHPALFWTAYAVWGLIEFGLVLRDRAKVRGQREDRGSVNVVVLLIGGGIALAFVAAASWRGFAIHASRDALFFAGLALMVCGIALRLWAVRTLGRFFRLIVTTHDDHELIGTGPYRRLSNPSYTGSMLTLVGLGLMFGNWLSLASLVLLPLAGFAWRIRIEEASLRARFGPAFDAYRRARWALVPFVW